MLSNPKIREDLLRMRDKDSPWFVLASLGRLGFFESQGCSSAFDRSPKVPETAAAGHSRLDFVLLARDSFVAMAGSQDQWPVGIKFLCVHFDASSPMAIDQTTQAKIFNWEMSLQSPWDVHDMRGGLGDNKEFEEAGLRRRSRRLARARSGSKCSLRAS